MRMTGARRKWKTPLQQHHSFLSLLPYFVLKLTSSIVLNCVDAGLFTGTPTSTGPTSTAGASGTSSHCRRADPSTHKVTMLIVVELGMEASCGIISKCVEVDDCVWLSPGSNLGQNFPD